MDEPTFYLCTTPALPSNVGWVCVLHTKYPRCRVRVHSFNTNQERDEFVTSQEPMLLSNKIPMPGMVSLKIPTAYEFIELYDECTDEKKLTGLMKRIADWHFAMTKIAY